MNDVLDRRIALRIVERTLVRIWTWRTGAGWYWELVIGTRSFFNTEGAYPSEQAAIQAALDEASGRILPRMAAGVLGGSGGRKLAA